MTLTFIIPVKDGERFIARCLEHVERQMRPGDEVIVVDNGSMDGTLEIVRRWGRARILEIPGVTIAALRNRGAEVARGDLLAFIDCDCLLMEGWRGRVEAVMSDPEVHATGSVYDLPEDARWIERAWFANRSTTAHAAVYLYSGNLVVRASVFREIDGFDARLETDEDYELGVRLNRLGFCVWEDPAIRAVHLGNPKSLGEFYRKERWHARGGMKLWSGGRLDKPMLLTLAFMATWIAALAALPFVVAGPVSAWLVPPLLLAVPAVMTSYRLMQSGRLRFLPHLLVLCTVFFLARSHTALGTWLAPGR
ncbi:MAG: glycosyltransferase [Gemmatimonadota bacterium]|jgi:glycosyltransferase involved in cell wall biosynthesis